MNVVRRAYDTYSERGAAYLAKAALKAVVANENTIHLLRFVETELETAGTCEVPLRRRLGLLRNGFHSGSWNVYRLNENDRDEYVPEFHRAIYARQINGEFAQALDNKLLTYHLLGTDAERLPDLYGYVDDGRWYAGDGSDVTARPASTVVHDHLERDGNLVIKGVIGTRGQNVLLCSIDDGRVSVNDEPVSDAAFDDRVDDLNGWIVTEHVEQAAYARDVYPAATNTVRVVTMIDPETAKPFVAAAVQRIGTERSRPLDNWSVGGLSARVDLETGSLGPAVQYPYAGDLRWFDSHPGTAADIRGVEIPGWASIRSDLLDVAARVPYVEYAGWDLVVTGPGEFRIVEVNNNTDVDLLQVHEPLLTADRVRRFYEYHGVV